MLNDLQPDKPFMKWDELADLLDDRNISNYNKENAINILKHNSYYELINNYKRIFLKTIKDESGTEKEVFKDGVTLEYIRDFSMFDKSFQSILIKYSLYVEIYFKNIVSYVLSDNIGEKESEYLNISKYEDKYNTKMPHLDTILSKLINTKEKYRFNPTAHYRKNHNNVPPWILLKNVTFNNMISLYKALPSDLKEKIMFEMLPDSFDWKIETNKQFFIDSLNIIKNNRNKISHHNLFLTPDEQFRINLSYIFSNEKYKEDFLHNILSDNHNIEKYNKGLYPYIILLLVFNNDMAKKIDFLYEISQFIDSYRTKDKSPYLFHYIELTNLPKTFGHLNIPIV